MFCHGREWGPAGPTLQMDHFSIHGVDERARVAGQTLRAGGQRRVLQPFDVADHFSRGGVFFVDSAFLKVNFLGIR